MPIKETLLSRPLHSFADIEFVLNRTFQSLKSEADCGKKDFSSEEILIELATAISDHLSYGVVEAFEDINIYAIM